MEEFNYSRKEINVAGRLVTEILINFGNFQAARLFIDRVTGLGGQLNLNISRECLAIPECSNNILEYVGLALIGMGVIRAVEQIFWRKITNGKKGDERRDGGYK
ncbi:MAG: hypothetical protein NZM02_01505 [Patescibacteria group bacterium]|nr:hypothetical protein [Patescibacteria group bacterium]